MGNSAGYGIGTYQSISGGITYEQGFPTQPFQNYNPYAGTYGGVYGYVLDTRIQAPAQVSYTPIPEIALDGTGISIVRGWPSMTWQYPTMKPDYWYYLRFLWSQSARVPAGFQYIVLLQYPDPTGSGSLLQSLARMDPPVQSQRTVGAYQSVQLKFTSIGQETLTPGTPIVVLS